MPHIRAICQATIDNPHADGIVLDGGFGLVQQFRFQDHFETRPGDLSRHPEPEWDYTAAGQHNVVPIPELNAVAPRGICDCQDMTLYDPEAGTGDWEKTNAEQLANCSNLWKELYPVGHPRAKYLFFYDARGAYNADVGYFGEVTSRTQFHDDPNFSLRALRYAPNPNLPHAGYCYLELQLLGDSQTGQWTLVVPVAGTEAQARFPRLGWRRTPGDDWEVLAEFRTGAHEAGALRAKPFQQIVTWETVDGHILLNIDGRRVVYFVPEHLRPPSEPFIAGGPMRIIVYGHAAALNVTPILYPLGDIVDCYVERGEYFPVDNTVFVDTPELRALAWEPAGTAALAEAECSTVGHEDRWVPSVRFTSPSEHRRAVAYLHEMDFPPEVSAGTSDPYQTQGEDLLLSASGELTSDWRNASCALVLDVDRSAAESMPSWKGNNKLSVVAGWDDGSSSETATQFTGYLTDAAHVRRGERPERVRIVLHARDGFVRLEKKHWQHLGSFVEWTLENTFHRVLNQCGVPDSLIQFTGDSNLIVPAGLRRCDPRFDFREDTSVIEGLNRLVAACSYVWGVNQDGTWFCRSPVEYSGTPDFTLDDDTIVEEDVTFALQADALDDALVGRRPFVNSVFVRIDRGAEQEEVWRRDADSHQTESADDFIGDDWWHVFVGHDEQSASALAERILNERQQRQKLLHFRCSGRPDLFPDQFLQVDATGIRVPQGSIFQVTRKRWQATDDGDFTTDFDCKLVP